MSAPPSTGPFRPEFARASELIGKRWTGAVIWALFHDVRRFSEIADTIPGISKNMLAERLRELEREGVVERIVVSEAPPHVEYELTNKGMELRDILRAIDRWARNHDLDACDDSPSRADVPDC